MSAMASYPLWQRKETCKSSPQAGDGAEAVALCKKHQPDIVLLDLRMPKMDGLDVITQIQSLGLPSKVVVLTTYESEQDIHLALKAGARGYLLKDTPRPDASGGDSPGPSWRNQHSAAHQAKAGRKNESPGVDSSERSEILRLDRQGEEQ